MTIPGCRGIEYRRSVTGCLIDVVYAALGFRRQVRSSQGPESKKRPRRTALIAAISEEIGAGEEIRTLDPNLGKVVLYH